MPALTVKNIPEPLLDRIRTQAKTHHRSLNGEVLHCLGLIFDPQVISPEQRIERIRRLRNVTPRGALTENVLTDAKKGRP